LTAVVLIFTLALLPIATLSIVDDVVNETNRTYRLTDPSDRENALHRVHMELIALNEGDGMVTIRATIAQRCGPFCLLDTRFTFLSLLGVGRPVSREELETLPVIETVTIKRDEVSRSQTMRLPVFGDPIRYPFDDYELALVVAADRVQPDGALSELLPEEPATQFFITVQNRIPRVSMSAPTSFLSTTRLEGYTLVSVDELRLYRPTYLAALAVLLTLLVTAAAAYAVFMRPLDQLVINAGALVLGVWGIRAILLGTGLTVVTAVDLVLSGVILFLLLAITVRTLWLLEDGTDWLLTRRLVRPAAPPPKPEAALPRDVVPERGAATGEAAVDRTEGALRPSD
jgi:hypothetical protein